MKTFFIILGLLVTVQLHAECSGGTCGVPSQSFRYGMNYYAPPTYYYYAPPQSTRFSTTAAQELRFRLILTNLPPNADIFVDGKKYSVNEKTTRSFDTDILEAGAYKYLLEIKYNDGVKEITRRKKLLFNAGDVMTVDFYNIEIVTNMTTSTPPTAQKPNFPVVPPDEARNEAVVGTEKASTNPLGTKKAMIRFFVPENTIILMNGTKWASSGKERNFTQDLPTSVDTVYHFEFIYVDSKNVQQDLDRKIAIRGGESHIISLFQD